MTVSGTGITGMGGTIIFVLLLLVLAVYMLPSIIALAKRSRRTKVILFNIFLGWTVVMWIISLVWACKRVEVQTPNRQYVSEQPAAQPQYRGPVQTSERGNGNMQ